MNADKFKSMFAGRGGGPVKGGSLDIIERRKVITECKKELEPVIHGTIGLYIRNMKEEV